VLRAEDREAARAEMVAVVDRVLDGLLNWPDAS
jgi:hypothetical protein